MILKFTNKALDALQKALDGIESKLQSKFDTPAYQEDEPNDSATNMPASDPVVGLDVFGNYICLNDLVIDVAYNDNRSEYVTVMENAVPYAYTEIDGPINRMLIKYDVYEELKRVGHVCKSRKPGFLHVTNFDCD